MPVSVLAAGLDERARSAVTFNETKMRIELDIRRSRKAKPGGTLQDALAPRAICDLEASRGRLVGALDGSTALEIAVEWREQRRTRDITHSGLCLRRLSGTSLLPRCQGKSLAINLMRQLASPALHTRL